MIDAILLDGTKDPVCIRLGDKEVSEFKSGAKKSMTWAGSALAWKRESETPPKYFNFTRVVTRWEPGPDGEKRAVKEVLIFTMLSVRPESTVPGLRVRDLDEHAEDGPVTVQRHGDILAEQFLYPEKYALMGRTMEVAA